MLSTKLKEAAGNSADATLYVDDVFSTYLYTGTGATQTITNGIDLAGKGGLVWTKRRSANTDSNSYNVLIDTARGGNYSIFSNTTSGGVLTNYISSFNSDGYTLSGTDQYVNGNTPSPPYTYTSWTFREAAKFFDVVTYTGTGSARTIAHSLGVAPGMIIVKRTGTASDWQVYNRGLASAAYAVQLNLTNAQASAPTVWNSTAPTSSVFSVGTDATVNASGGTYVAYLYAHDTSSTGIIQCGSFNLASAGVYSVNLGWEAQYVLIKRTDSAENWFVADVMRTGFNQAALGTYISTGTLSPNTSAAEGGSTYQSPTSTGFGGYSPTSGNYIYMAIRRPNKPPTTGTQVFSPLAVTNTTGTLNTTGFPIDLQMIGARGDSIFGRLFNDRLRGVSTTTTESGRYLDSASTASEDTAFSTTRYWGNTGYQTPAIYDGGTPVSWNFKRAPGFFDVVCYTGTGSATTQAHNLTVAPEMMIVKGRSDVYPWWVYVSLIGNTKYSVLNTTAMPATSSSAWNNTTPTSSAFSIGTDTSVNGSGALYVAYLFATLAGISKVGSYTGNGTGQAIACGFSAGARFVLIKRTDSTGNWYTFDSARGLTSGSSPYLLLNSTAAETTGNNGVYASTGGFTLGSTASTTTNINGASYIYLSVA